MNDHDRSFGYQRVSQPIGHNLDDIADFLRVACCRVAGRDFIDNGGSAVSSQAGNIGDEVSAAALHCHRG